MDEHDDDLEQEVAEGAEIEVEEFPIDDDEEAKPGKADDSSIDPDESEL